jgi:hypothetical protein
MWRGIAVLLLAVGCGAVSGCADDPMPTSVESFCGGICEAVVRCSPGRSHALCQNDCVGDPLNRELSNIRPEAAAAVGACLAQESCETIFNGPFDACWDRAHAEIAPAAHLQAFCPGYATSAFNCGYVYGVEQCQNQLDIWTDAFLDALEACTQQATCDATDACLEARFGGN